jgi:hypothetical protein
MSNPRYLGILLVASVPFAIYHYVTTRPVERPAGVLVEKDPTQTDPDSATPISDEGFVLQPRAGFTADVRVLSRERYHMGQLSDLAPLGELASAAGD